MMNVASIHGNGIIGASISHTHDDKIADFPLLNGIGNN